VLDAKWLAKESEAPTKAPMHSHGKRENVDEEEARVDNVRYDELALRLANAMMDLSISLRVPCVQFEGSKYLEVALTKVKLENKNIFEHCDGKRWMLNYIQIQEKTAFEAK